MAKHGFIREILSKRGSKGRLHRALGIPADKPIPKARLASARNSSRTFEGKSVSKMASFAGTLSKLRK